MSRPQLTQDQFFSLKRMVDFQREYGDRASWSAAPLEGRARELVEMGFLIADPMGDIIGLSVTEAGMRQVAH